MKLNIFLLKYLLSEDFCSHLLQNGISNARFDATSNVEDPNTFFSKLGIADAESYAKFTEEVVRCEIENDVFYIFFRNAKEDRPDIGTGRYTFAKPSSVEIGYVDGNGTYVSYYKEHYVTWTNNLGICLSATNKIELKLLTKSIEYAIINSMISKYNTDHGTNIPLKPVDSTGRAIIVVAQQKPKVKVNSAGVGDIYDNKIVDIANKL